MIFPVDRHFFSVLSNGLKRSPHGIDIAMPVNVPVVAAGNGAVVYAGPEASWSKEIRTSASKDRQSQGPMLVVLELDQPVVIDGRSYIYVSYGNLNCLSPKLHRIEKPVTVKAGDCIGRSGSEATEPYLNLRLNQARDGSIGAELDRDRLHQFIWRDVAGISTPVPTR